MKTMKKFTFRGASYYFKYFEDNAANSGNYFVELSSEALNKYTPKHFVVGYNDNKVPLKPSTLMTLTLSAP